MAEFVPFRGVLYNPERLDDLSKVVAPPYDVISPGEQETLYDRSPYNMVRLILGKSFAGDAEGENAHTRAAEYFGKWLESGILVQDARPAFYVTSVDFQHEGRLSTRWGIIGLVRLEPFSKGVVLPHERTFSKVKSERLHLMKACHANFSPVFGLFADNGALLETVKAAALGQAPDMDLVDGHHLRHRLWRIADEALCDRIGGSMRSERIFIADGHHRYETALNYRDLMMADHPGFTPSHPANFVMMSLSSMADPGLIIYPAHRILRQVPLRGTAPELLEILGPYFDAQTFPANEEGIGGLGRFLENHRGVNAIGICFKGHPELHAITLKMGVMERLFAHEQPAALLDLDVTVLTRLVMMELLGYDQQSLDDESRIAYRTRIDEAVGAVSGGEGEMAFILNPTRIDQVRRVAEEGLIMPRKSTYFYPKVISGQVLNLLR